MHSMLLKCCFSRTRGKARESERCQHKHCSQMLPMYFVEVYAAKDPAACKHQHQHSSQLMLQAMPIAAVMSCMHAIMLAHTTVKSCASSITR